MIGITEKERGTDDRGKNDRGTRRVGHVDFVHLRGTDPKQKALVYVLPKEPILLDEISIKPSQRWRNQEAKQRAKQALSKAKAGKRVPENDVIKLQQQLLSTERQEEFAGRTSEGRELAAKLGELRRSN